MKKIFTLLLVVCFTTTLFAQTIVSTSPSNKNFILEEYTGTNCVYCPDGHKIANQIMDNNPGRAYAINIHQGGFSGNDPDYKTEWGNALATQYSINSYPNGTCNRGSGTVARNLWTNQCTTILAQPSPVNVAATATINWDTRELSVYVEAYYTGNAANPTNKLNVVLLQNNVLGPQTGGSSYYPAMVRFGTYYQHMHMLRHLLTGQWGVVIPATTTGTFYSETFTYTIPAHIRNVPLHLEDLEVLAFVCEDNKTILSGCKAELSIQNKPATIGRIEMVDDKHVASCDGSNSAICYVRNSNDFTINSVELTYKIADGTPEVYLWNKRTIAARTWDTIHLPTFMLEPNVNQNVTITISKINGNASNFALGKIFKKDVVAGDAVMKLVITTDRYASETTFKIFKPDGTILLSGGPWTDLGSSGTTVREFDFIPATEGCHRVEVYDAYGDGINAGYGAGYVKILDSDGAQIYYNNGQFGSKLTAVVTVGEAIFYTITASAGENGTISPIGAIEYLEGKSVKYTFTPNVNYEVEEVFIDNKPMGLAQATSYTFPAVDKDYSIYVTFKLMPKITASAGENGTISPTGETFFATGSSAVYNFTPNPNYEVEEVFIDNEPMGLAQATSYTFNAVDKNYAIHVTFKELSGIKDINGVTIAVAPNPVNDQLVVTGRYDKLEIISLTGQILTTVHNQPVVDVSSLAKGVYFVKIQTNGETCVFKVVK